MAHNVLISYWGSNKFYAHIQDLAQNRKKTTSEMLCALIKLGLVKAPSVKKPLPVDKRTGSAEFDNYKLTSFVLSRQSYDQTTNWGKKHGLNKHESVLQMLTIGFKATGYKVSWEVLEEKWQADLRKILGAVVYKKLKAYEKAKKISFRKAYDDVLREGINKCSPEIFSALMEAGLGGEEERPKARPLASPRKKAVAKKVPVKKKAPAKSTRRAA